MSNKRFWFSPKSAVPTLLALAGICLGQSKWEWRNPFPTGDNLNSVTYGNEQYVAVGSRGTIITSPDGATWATSSSGTNRKINYVINSDNQFVAVGDSGTILTSPDGANWATNRAGTTMNLNSVVHGNSQFVVVGDSSTILTSRDGSKWTKQNLDSVYNLKSLAFGDNLFVALCANGTILTSSDGIAWTKRNSLQIDPSQIGGSYPSSYSYYSINSVAYGNHRFVAVGDSARYRYKTHSSSFPVILTSIDGITWTRTILVKDSVTNRNSFKSMTFANGQFVAIKDRMILSSPDGMAWTEINSGADSWLRYLYFGHVPFIAFGKDQFVVVGEGGMIQTSPDCSNWVDRRSRLAVHSPNKIIYGKNRFVALADSKFIITSTDGKTWTTESFAPSNINTVLLSIAYGNDRFVVVGGNGLVMTSTDGMTWTETYFHGSLFSVTYGKDKFVVVGGGGKVLTSTDGAVWKIENSGINFSCGRGNSITYGNNQFVAIVEKSNSYGIIEPKFIAASTDGITWTERDLGENIYSITYCNNQFVATGSGSGELLTSPDGITWKKHFTGANNEIKSVVYANNQYVAVGHYGTLQTSTDGNTWIRENLDNMHDLNAVAYGNGLFVVGGDNAIILVSQTKNDNPIKATYIGNGTIEFEATFAISQQYVEIFSRQNGVQNIAQNIVGNVVNNTDGTFSYKLSRGGYTNGDVVEYRFYSHAQNSQSVFTPGPSENSWSSLTIKPSKATYTGNGAIVYEATFATPQQYVEIISRQNGLQNVAQNIVGNVVNNNDGTVTYKLTRGGYNEGDKVEYRFYSYAKNSPAVFTPGPVENTWDNLIVAK